MEKEIVKKLIPKPYIKKPILSNRSVYFWLEKGILFKFSSMFSHLRQRLSIAYESIKPGDGHDSYKIQIEQSKMCSPLTQIFFKKII